MNTLPTLVTTLSVATIFYIWRNYAQFLGRKNRVLRERVAYMLWVMAHKPPDGEDAVRLRERAAI
jgi:hypothetical protein